MSSLTEYTANCFILEGIDFYIHNKYVCVSLSPISSFEKRVLLSGHFHCRAMLYPSSELTWQSPD